MGKRGWCSDADVLYWNNIFGRNCTGSRLDKRGNNRRGGVERSLCNAAKEESERDARKNTQRNSFKGNIKYSGKEKARFMRAIAVGKQPGIALGSQRLWNKFFVIGASQKIVNAYMIEISNRN